MSLNALSAIKNYNIGWEVIMANFKLKRVLYKIKRRCDGRFGSGGGIASPAFAAYPERNIDVIIPTREGGGADRLFRAFTSSGRIT